MAGVSVSEFNEHASVARSDAGQRPGPYQTGATPQYLFSVAQIVNLLYRRLPIGWALPEIRRSGRGAVLQDGILRYGRLAVCATNTAVALNTYTPQVWSLEIYEPQRGSVPKPNVVPRLRDYVGLSCQHDGNPNGVAAIFTNVSIIICHLVSPNEVERARWDATPPNGVVRWPRAQPQFLRRGSGLAKAVKSPKCLAT